MFSNKALEIARMPNTDACIEVIEPASNIDAMLAPTCPVQCLSLEKEIGLRAWNPCDA